MTQEITSSSKLLQLHNGQPMATSPKLAQHFGKDHSKVLRAIQNLECSQDFREANFGLCEYTGNTEGTSRKYPMYLMTKDGFMFLVMGFTGKEAAKWKEAYIGEFNAMQQQLYQQKLEHKRRYDIYAANLEDQITEPFRKERNASRKELAQLRKLAKAQEKLIKFYEKELTTKEANHA